MAHTGTRFEVHGTVQGVGFRPFVYRLASDLGLSGDVSNVAGHVVVRVAGPAAAIDVLRDRLVSQAPPQARVTEVTATRLPGAVRIAAGFRVLASRAAGSAPGTQPGPRVPVDLAPCEACRTELFDPADRRFRYPFINCVDCGPRASIIEALPYDRQRTSMRWFAFCADCDREYHDPGDRRFHAEPVACPRCGPSLRWGSAAHSAPARSGEQALRECERLIRAGAVVAVKGVGGYQLVCDAGQEPAVRRLRRLKRRPDKPFAVMVKDVAAARALAEVTLAEARRLQDVSAPIVLLRSRLDEAISAEVAPGLLRLGLFLPSSPLHHLLLQDLDRPLVVTSGNRGSEPIIVDDEQAEQVLGPWVDGVLSHDRPIRTRYDDSVQRIVAGRPMTVRRARGLSPGVLSLPLRPVEPILAVGAQLKHTATLAFADQAVIGPHTGDLEDAQTYAAFEATVAALSVLHGVQPVRVAHDLHPGYLSTRYARRFAPKQRIAVQHHHAHVVAAAAEHGLPGPFLGVAYDGLGLGDDGTLWGGELLIADYLGYRRLGRFATAPLPGGEAAVRRPTRMALGHLLGGEFSEPDDAEQLATGFLDRLPPSEVDIVRRMLAAGVNCPRASSAGRLFDTVAGLLGLCDRVGYEGVGYEGQAAIALETAAGTHPGGPAATTALPWRMQEKDGLLVYDSAPTVRAVLSQDAGPAELAARFHRTMAEVTLALVRHGAHETGVRRVCLGGGVFQNELLTSLVLELLQENDFEVFIGAEVPVNDGGISYGQAAVAAVRLAGGG